MTVFIPATHRQNLAKYKYSGTDKSLLSKYLLNPYWNWLVTLFPTSVAPNLITLSGLACVGVNVLTLLYYSPDLETPCPSWVYFSFSIGLFVYWSFDAIDGKQARRTGTSGPLGELFDHGCDAINTTLEVILTASALNFHQSWWTVAAQFATLCNFYLTTWEEYNTGTLYLSYFSGPVEGILMICVFYFITGIYGVQFWENRLFDAIGLHDTGLPHWLNIQFNTSFIVFAAFGLGANIVASSMNVMEACKKQNRPFLPALGGLVPFFSLSGLVWIWLASAPHIVHEYQIPFTFFTGLSFAYMVGNLILAHVTKREIPQWNVLFLPVLLGAADAAIGKLTPAGPFLSSPEHTSAYIYFCLGLSLSAYGFFVTEVIDDICRFFDINCLTIKHKEDKKE